MEAMNRKGFIAWILAALGVSATGVIISSSKDVPVSTPTPPPAPPSTRLEVMRAASDAGKTHFHCNGSTLERIVASIDSRFEYGVGFQAFRIEGLRWIESRFMRDGDIWCGGAPHQWDLMT